MAQRLLISRFALMILTLLLTMPTLSGCLSSTQAPDGYQIVNLDGTDYTLELVADDQSRTVGLGGRTEIPEFGGMLFSFPKARKRQFLMRDCLIDIDIMFLDAGGRIVAMHAMVVEEQQGDNETIREYETRLTKYPSKYSAQYAIEIRGGLLETMNLKLGDKIELDFEYLKAVTQ